MVLFRVPVTEQVVLSSVLLQEQVYKTLIFHLSETYLIGISFLLVSSEEVEEIIQTCEPEKGYAILFNKFQRSRTHHSFIPKENKLLMKTISKDSHVSEVLLPSSVPRSCYQALFLELMQHVCIKVNDLLVLSQKSLMKQMMLM